LFIAIPAGILAYIVTLVAFGSGSRAQ